MNDEKKYIKPEADIIIFQNEDVIVTSDGWWGSGIGGVDDTQVP